jgi:rod shape determining protein RodA
MGIYEPIETGSRSQRTFTFAARLLGALKLDGPLLIGLGLITLYGFVILYSASGQSWNRVADAAIRAALGGFAMCALAQVKPAFLRRLAFPLWVFGVVLLVVVDITGHIGKGAQRWLDLGFIRFQPSEIMKLAVPMTCAWWLHDRPLPPSLGSLLMLSIIILIPAGLTILQPDLGTGGLILIGGMMVVIMAGLQFRIIFGLAGLGALAAWLAWQYVLYDYQKQRVLTLLDPEADKLGAGYHIIQSQIAIGSGGVFGKGFMQGTQTHLEFIPERTTDFVFAAFSEEFGLLGVLLLMGGFLFLIYRGLMIAAEGPTLFARLLAGAITLSFFTYCFVNMGMVSGILPVVGIPLPFISYGGTAMVTLGLGLGILMSIARSRRLVQT